MDLIWGHLTQTVKSSTKNWRNMTLTKYLIWWFLETWFCSGIIMVVCVSALKRNYLLEILTEIFINDIWDSFKIIRVGEEWRVRLINKIIQELVIIEALWRRMIIIETSLLVYMGDHYTPQFYLYLEFSIHSLKLVYHLIGRLKLNWV